MPHLDVDGAALYYETDGHISRPAVLLIHAGVANLRMWDSLVPSLAEEHFVIRFDCRGFGATSCDDVEFSDRADARDLLDHLGIGHATVVGCSRGTRIAIDLAVETPGRVSGLVTIGGGPSGFPEVELQPHEEAILDRMDAALADEDWPLLNDLEVQLWSIGASRDQSTLDPGFVDLAYELNRANLAHVHEHPIPIRLDPAAIDRLVDIAVPTLVTVGEDDLTEDLAAFEYLVTAIPGADSARFDDCAHLPSVERAEDFTRVLSGWLAGHSL